MNIATKINIDQQDIYLDYHPMKISKISLGLGLTRGIIAWN
jgi:hypothetical protein